MEQEEFFKALAGQLRKPTGDFGKQVATNMNSGNAQMNRLAIKALDLSQDDQVLELGMGNGHFVNEILASAPNVTYTGCDFSETMIAEASEINKNAITEGRAKFLHVPANELPFAPETFDKALGVNIIYFWNNPLEELGRIKRVLNPGGRLVLGMRTEKSLRDLPFTRHGFNIRSREEIRKLLTDAGFEVNSFEENTEGEQTFNENPIRLGSWTVTAFSTN